MPKKFLTESELVEIMIKLKGADTVQTLAVEYQVHPSTIYRRLAIFADEGRLGRKKHKRRIKLREIDTEKLRTYVLNVPFATLKEIKETLNLPVCNSTVIKYCKMFGLGRQLSTKKFLVSAVNCEERMCFARRRCLWSLDRWKNVVFCDEAGLDNSGFHRRHVWRPRATRYDRNYLYRAPNKSLRVNFFSWVSKYGVGELIFYRKMNSQTYCNVVVPKMIESLRNQFGSDNFLIVHDNAKFSQCDSTVHFLRENNFSRYFLSIPAYSPDMNLIENLWALLKHSQKSLFRKRSLFKKSRIFRFNSTRVDQYINRDYRKSFQFTSDTNESHSFG